LHWLDLPSFYREVERVVKSGGLFAVWCYHLAEVTPAVDALIQRFYRDIVGPYWPPERRLVEDGYRHANIGMFIHPAVGKLLSDS
jgi:hypothetical protein